MLPNRIPDEGGTTFSTTGGKGSISYNLSEISLAGSKIQRSAERISTLIAQLNTEGRNLSDAASGSSFYPHEALAAITEAHWAGMTASGGIAELARDTSAAASNYAATENAAAGKARQLSSAQALMAGYSATVLGPFAAVKVGLDANTWYSNAKKNGYRDATENALNGAVPYALGLFGLAGVGAYALTGGLRVDKPKPGVGAVGLLRHAADWVGVNTPGELSMRRVPPLEWALTPEDWRQGKAFADPNGGMPVRVEATLAGMLQGSQDAYGYPPGSIVVDRLERADGSHAWIVHLPGTQDWSKPDTQNPFDLEGDLEGMTAAQAQQFTQRQVLIQDLMRQALADAGALPGEDTLITGHSGGGIHAAAAAANPAFLADVNVKMIAIAGASGGGLPVRADIDVVDLQNDFDIVSASDYGKSPDTPKWVTITSHRPGAIDEQGIGKVVAQAHDLGNYIQDAKDMENSKIPAIAGSQEALATFLGGAAVVSVAGGAGALSSKSAGSAGSAGTSVSGQLTSGQVSSGQLTVKRTVYQGVDVNRYPAAKPDTGPRPNPEPGQKPHPPPTQ